MKRALIAKVLTYSGLLSLSRWLRPWQGVVGLNYHRVGNISDSPFDRGTWSATTEAFESQVAWLKTEFDLIRPRDLPEALRSRHGRFLLITFDDGYRDNYTDAFQVLRRHGVPATFFITTGYLDSKCVSWWDQVAWMIRHTTRPRLDLSPWLTETLELDSPHRESAIRTVIKLYKSLEVDRTGELLRELAIQTELGSTVTEASTNLWMTWDMVREMHAAGMEIGGHTINHPILSNLAKAEQWKEIEGSIARIAEEIGIRPRSFSYPNGGPRDFNDDTRACLKESGIEFAFSYYGGYQSFPEWDPFDIRRISVEFATSMPVFQCMVTLPAIFGRETR